MESIWSNGDPQSNPELATTPMRAYQVVGRRKKNTTNHHTTTTQRNYKTARQRIQGSWVESKGGSESVTTKSRLLCRGLEMILCVVLLIWTEPCAGIGDEGSSFSFSPQSVQEAVFRKGYTQGFFLRWLRWRPFQKYKTWILLSLVIIRWWLARERLASLILKGLNHVLGLCLRVQSISSPFACSMRPTQNMDHPQAAN